MWIWITDNFKWNTSHSNHLVGPALIIRKPFLELPFFSAAEETIFLLRCPSLPCLVWRVKTICCSQLPRHYKGSHAYSKVWRTNKTITFFLSLQLLPLLLSCQISIGSKFCINDDDDWEILIYKPCPPRQQIIFKAAQEHNNGFILGFSTAILLQFSVLKVTFFRFSPLGGVLLSTQNRFRCFWISALNSTTVISNAIFGAKIHILSRSQIIFSLVDHQGRTFKFQKNEF